LEQIITHLTEHTGAYLLVALMLGAVSMVAAVLLLFRLRSAVRPLARVRESGADASQILQAVVQTTEQTGAGLSALESRLAAQIESSKWAIKHLGLVRYDAFEGARGMQSFSLCMLNEHKDGVLLTYLFNQKSPRSYAVKIDRGVASRELSEEESRAIDGALSNKPSFTPTESRPPSEPAPA
jgi:hypothetical protein